MANVIPKNLHAIPPPRELDDDRDWYYAFMTTLEPVIERSGKQNGWEVAFEVAPKGWVDLRFFGPEPETAWAVPKGIPELLFHVAQISEADLRHLLGITDPNDGPAEGQWYLIKLVDEPGSGISGDYIDLLASEE
jgi:hypothetical protein